MKILDLASGAAHFLSPPAAVENTIAALRKNETFYGEIAGLPTLREAVAKRYKSGYQVNLSPENVLITAGTKHALFTLFSVLLKPGDEVILPAPAWFGFTEIFKLLQVKPVLLETVPEDNYAIRPEKLASLISGKTKLFLYSNPGNPTGKIYAKPEIAGWLQVLEKYPEIKILSDEIYDLIVYDQQKITSLTEFPDLQQKLMLVNGFSKNFGMSGWRIGYIIAPMEILEKCVHFQQTTISGVNPFIQEGAVATLETLPDFLPERLQALHKNREIICHWLDKQPGISYLKPQAAYYIFADLTHLLKTGKLRQKGLTTSETFCRYLQEELKILMQPGEKFNAPGNVRITFAVPEKDLLEALKRLEDFLALA
ncbi:aminotransferase class I/II-fold pyridoxal phosphate-dependent enzyme [Adhaeribacter sp. BT258]|uniref:Aminotransferase n=1 Tax=Adhaeribacter terrigena TaxID=2793070 RepID=A0ABS1C616_9BACT|nr:aminotransferase class I/II-fold pyridoxal phosphate-dependent enzyme [Adhaeribacter terrigena]MBK0404676.1 aminotransferase class I/II-fold pyridoxal phosphate-dependent enzyme [Adhaeribacter terrigena]